MTLPPLRPCGPALLICAHQISLVTCHSAPEKLPLIMVPGHSRAGTSQMMSSSFGSAARALGEGKQDAFLLSPSSQPDHTGRCPEPSGGDLQSSSPSAQAVTTETKSSAFVFLHRMTGRWLWSGLVSQEAPASQQDRSGRGPPRPPRASVFQRSRIGPASRRAPPGEGSPAR